MRTADGIVLAIAALGGAVCAVGATMYLNLYIGTVPMPVSAFGFGALLTGISVAARRLGQPWYAAVPVLGFLVMVLAFLLGGPGGSTMYTQWRLLLLLVCGIGMPTLAANLASSKR